MDDVIADVLNDPAVTALGTAIAGAMVALWVAAAWWAFTDATRRTGSTFTPLVAAGWIVLSTPLLLPLSLAVYAFARPQQSAAEGRSRRLAAELVDEMHTPAEFDACPACASPADPAWVRCPACSTWLAAPCAHCGEWSARTLEACPWCGAEDRATPSVEPSGDEEAAQLVRGRRIRRRVQAVGPGRARLHRPLSRRQALPGPRPAAPLGRR